MLEHTPRVTWMPDFTLPSCVLLFACTLGRLYDECHWMYTRARKSNELLMTITPGAINVLPIHYVLWAEQLCFEWYLWESLEFRGVCRAVVVSHVQSLPLARSADAVVHWRKSKETKWCRDQCDSCRSIDKTTAKWICVGRRMITKFAALNYSIANECDKCSRRYSYVPHLFLGFNYFWCSTELLALLSWK